MTEPTPPRTRKWVADGSHLVDPSGSERLDLNGRETFVAELAAALNCYHKLPRVQ